MERELSLKRCKTCGKTVQILEDSNVEIMCCNEIMETIVPNSVDAAIEKHVPEYTVEDGKILVKVNHVMEEEHYIEWICLVTDEKECKKLHFVIHQAQNYMLIAISMVYGKTM